MEHGVKGITRFRSLLNNKASAVETMETKLDVCIGIYNANMLFKEHLEDTIPRRPDKKGVSSRMITPTVKPSLRLGRRISLHQTPPYFQGFRDFIRKCTYLSSDRGATLIVDPEEGQRQLRSNTLELDSRPTVLKRATSLMASGFFLFLQVARSRETQGCFLARFTVGASFLQVKHLCSVLLSTDGVQKKFCCCGMG